MQNYGCGEILLTPIDYEGTQKGFDFNVLDKSLNSISNTDNTVSYNTVSYNTMSLKNNMTFCMIPKPRCSKCRK